MAFDPYAAWLNIAPDRRPPTYYDLLGLEPFEADLEKIDQAALRRMAKVRTHQLGPHSDLSQDVLAELARARLTLIDPDRKAQYDAELRPGSGPRPRVSDRAALVPLLILAAAALVVGLGTWGYRHAQRHGSELALIRKKPDVPAAGAPRQTPSKAPDQVATRPPQPATGGHASAPLAPRPASNRPAAPEVKPTPSQPPVPAPPQPLPPSPAGAAAAANQKPAPAPKRAAELPPAKEPAGRSVKKTPVPDPAAQAKARAVIQHLFKADYAKRRPEDLDALAAKLLEQGIETQDDPTARFVLFREARDLATRAGDPQTALQAVEAMGDEYAVDVLDLKARLFATLERLARTPQANKALAEASLGLIDPAIAADRYTLALRLLAVAQAAARKARSAALIRRVSVRRKEVNGLKQEYERLQVASTALRDQPDEPGANLAMGKYLCLVKGDWDRGLPMLAKGSDPKLKALAAWDLDHDSEPATEVELGDAWWDLAEAKAGKTRAALQKRADHWYQQALPELSGLTRVRVEKRASRPLRSSP